MGDMYISELLLPKDIIRFYKKHKKPENFNFCNNFGVQHRRMPRNLKVLIENFCLRQVGDAAHSVPL